MHKHSKKFIIIFSILIVLLVGYAISNKFIAKKTTLSLSVKSSQEKLIISTFSIDNKGSILSLDIKSRIEKYLITDRHVSITGDLYKDNSKIVYADALGDYYPWQIYLHNFKENKIFQVTDNKTAKSHPRVSDDNSIFFLNAPNGVIKVAKIKIDTKSYDIIDNDDSDREVDTFSIKHNKLLISTNSISLRLKSWKENQGHLKPLIHTIFEVNSNTNRLSKIATIKASLIESISYNSTYKKVLIGGSDINENPGVGIYELSLDTGHLTTIITDSTLANAYNSIVSKIAHPVLVEMSNDDSHIYFTGVPKNSKEIKVNEMSCYPTAIFSYNINTKELEKIFNPKVSSLIYGMTIKD
ncbi:S-layer protein [Clostridium bowmanii]|uniref:S-layer protein n=1 Tax=Clostridium bowmanii TaxID=132925 RepID=UPI001C0E8A2B|nr:S-layer protein [Clostridium bowmanii]MBU3188205.1 S-layer protein [Clostridium bowmanii]MCA1072387.1 S-layer protein [Clostridium bowmanii]